MLNKAKGIGAQNGQGPETASDRARLNQAGVDPVMSLADQTVKELIEQAFDDEGNLKPNEGGFIDEDAGFGLILVPIRKPDQFVLSERGTSITLGSTNRKYGDLRVNWRGRKLRISGSIFAQPTKADAAKLTALGRRKQKEESEEVGAITDDSGLPDLLG